MAYFQSTEAVELTLPIFRRIQEDWFLLTVTKEGKRNTMTASWGGLGVLWGMPVAFLFVRPTRYTHTLIGKESHITLSFFGKAYREALRICGIRSGRDSDKEREAGLHPFRVGRGFAYEEAELILSGVPLYGNALAESGLYAEELRKYYEKEPYHTVFICRIDEILERKDDV